MNPELAVFLWTCLVAGSIGLVLVVQARRPRRVQPPRSRLSDPAPSPAFLRSIGRETP